MADWLNPAARQSLNKVNVTGRVCYHGFSRDLPTCVIRAQARQTCFSLQFEKAQEKGRCKAIISTVPSGHRQEKVDSSEAADEISLVSMYLCTPLFQSTQPLGRRNIWKRAACNRNYAAIVHSPNYAAIVSSATPTLHTSCSRRFPGRLERYRASATAVCMTMVYSTTAAWK